MKLRKIAIGLVVCAAMLAGCKDRSEMPPLDEGSSVTYSSTNSSSSSAVSTTNGESSSQSASGNVSQSPVQSSVQSTVKPAQSSSRHVHNYELKEYVAPTCVKDGHSNYTCECGDGNITIIEATGHNYSKTTVEADCENGGYTRYTCTVCEHSYDDNVKAALGHAWGEWTVTKNATTSAAGEKQSSCSRCGKTRSESIPKLEAAISVDEYTSEVIRLVNIERANHGLSPLSENSTLGDYAQLRSKEIVSFFAHTRPDGTPALNYLRGLGTLRTYGENIAMGQPTPEAVVDAWMNSEGHRANILNEKFTMIGVGCYKSGGAYYWVQIFGG